MRAVNRARRRQADRRRSDPRSRLRRGFTLVELMVVILIVLLLSAAAIPVLMPALQSRKISAAALILHAELAKARDSAIRFNEPRGVRLIPETPLTNPRFVWGGTTPAYSRMISIKPGPDYAEGLVEPLDPTIGIINNAGQTLLTLYGPIVTPPPMFPSPWLVISESKGQVVTVSGTPVYIPNPPTSWYWNVRQGDKIRIGESSRYYTIVGPMLIGPNAAANASNPLLSGSDQMLVNPDRYINMGSPASFTSTPSVNPLAPREFLILLDEQDNKNSTLALAGNSFIDEAWDGIDNDGDGIIDPGFNGWDDNGDGIPDDPAEVFINYPVTAYNGLDDNANTLVDEALEGGGEFEPEQPLQLTTPTPYTIYRQPVPDEGAREIQLPSGVVIDMTTWNAANSVDASGNPAPTVPQRSRLPVDPYTGYVDIMLAPNGEVLQPTAGPSQGPPLNFPFYHFWLADQEDVVEPLYGTATVSVFPVPIANPNYTFGVASEYTQFLLPMPKGTPGYTSSDDQYLTGQRKLISINTKTGDIATTSIEDFDVSGSIPLSLELPYMNAKAGEKENP